MQLIILVEWGDRALACRHSPHTPVGDHAAPITVPPLSSSMRWEPRSEHATRAFLGALGGAVPCPLAARAQQSVMPISELTAEEVQSIACCYSPFLSVQLSVALSR